MGLNAAKCVAWAKCKLLRNEVILVFGKENWWKYGLGKFTTSHRVRQNFTDFVFYFHITSSNRRKVHQALENAITRRTPCAVVVDVHRITFKSPSALNAATQQQKSDHVSIDLSTAKKNLLQIWWTRIRRISGRRVGESMCYKFIVCDRLLRIQSVLDPWLGSAISWQPVRVQFQYCFNPFGTLPSINNHSLHVLTNV